MSIEQAILAHAEALTKLAEAISATLSNPAAHATPKSGKGKAPAAAAPSEPEAPAHTPPIATEAPAAAPAPKDESSAPPVEFKRDIVPRFTALIESKGQAAGRQVIEKFDPSKTRLSEAVTTPAQMAEALAFINELLAA